MKKYIDRFIPIIDLDLVPKFRIFFLSSLIFVFNGSKLINNNFINEGVKIQSSNNMVQNKNKFYIF